VVRTGETACLAASLGDDERPSVAARVDECPDPTVGLANREDGNTGDVDGAIRAGVRQMGAQRSDHRAVAEQDVDLALPAGGVEIVVDRHREGAVERVGGVLVEMGEQAAGHVVPVVHPRGFAMVALGRLREPSVRRSVVGGHAGSGTLATATGIALDTTMPVTGS
jgi:hypothetical protein